MKITMFDNYAINIPQKTVADGRFQIKEFYDLVKLRAPHRLSPGERRVIKRFEALICGRSDNEMLAGKAQLLFWTIRDRKENWYRKKNIPVSTGLALIAYLEKKALLEGFGDKWLPIVARLKSQALRVKAGNKAILTGKFLQLYENLLKIQ